MADTIISTIFVLGVVFFLIVLPFMWLSRRRPWLRNLRRVSPFFDSQLGMLRFSFGFTACLWRGSIVLSPGVSVPLAIVGSRDGPDPVALQITKDLVAQFPSWQPSIEKALFEHCQPYAEMLASGELNRGGEPLPKIENPSDVWALISWVYVSVVALDGDLVAELGLTVPWDAEHTLGARFKTGNLIELNGSVVQP